MKLRAGRQRDRTDLVELLKAGLDADAVRAYLRRNAESYLPAFEKIVLVATAEEAAE